MELGAAAELLSQRRKGEANVTHGGEEGAAVEPRPVAVVRVSPLPFAEGETRREDADLHHRASLSSSSLHHCRSLFPLPSGFAAAAIESDAAEEESFLFRRRRRRPWLLLFIWVILWCYAEIAEIAVAASVTRIDVAAAVPVALKSPLQLPV
ncbi:uncharacterized protein DS421_12g368140 [Arachis hypogaea]|nr:uncharacterized protein DS421_12g368140 [Arachis hypogaea]